MNKSIKNIIKSVFGIILFLWLSYSIYNQIQNQKMLHSPVYDLFLVWDIKKTMLLCCVLVLMCCNWAVEAKKWQLLIRKAELLSFSKSLQSVLTGVAISMLTPNRIGEYMGRILYLKNVNKLKGITVTILGSFAQLLVTGGFGILGIVYYLFFQTPFWWLYLFLVASIFLFIAIAYVYFNMQQVANYLQRFSVLQKPFLYLEIVKRVERKELTQVIKLSLLRYMIYTVQFVLLLKLFLVSPNIIGLCCTLFLIFWAMAVVPTFAIAEVGVRGQLSILFLSVFTTNTLGIVSATACLWLINLIIPALLGCLFVYRFKLFDDEQ